MKKTILILTSILILAGCYPDYVRDYDDGAAVYTTYQYDLRTFVLGETEKFDFTVALGGVIDNTEDRSVKVEFDNSLLSADLSTLVEGGDYLSFTAIEGFLGTGAFGTVCQKYVTDEIFSSGIKAFSELPEAYYTVTGLDGMTIKSGRHTAVATIKATDFIKEDPNIYAPYYAIAFRILSAEDAAIIPTRDYEIIAVKCENKLFGQWAHRGTAKVVGTGESETYEYSEADDRVYTLTTQDYKSVLTDKIANRSGRLLLTIGDDNVITVSSPDGLPVEEISGEPSYFNGAKLLQNREIYLNYRITVDGVTSEIRDVLSFRSRTRDGVLEYQDENAENYN